MDTPADDSVSPTWLRRYRELQAYAERFGDCNLRPDTPGHESLGSWVAGMRSMAKRGVLSPARTALLNEIGFLWQLKGEHRKSTTFETWLKELQAYVAEHGNANVTAKSPGHGSLGLWASSQRVRRKKGLLTETQVKALNDLGFVWEYQHAKAQHGWIKRYHELEAFYLQHGHTDMPRTHPQRTLANWVWIQRLRRKGPYLKSPQLTAAQVKLLDKLGFKWDPHGENWQEHYLKLKAYGDKNARKYDPIEDGALSRWASTQRKAYHQGELDPGRVDQLNEIAFTWESKSVENNWADYYAELKAHHAQHGDANPLRHRFPRLGAWCVLQRQRRKKGEMPQSQIELLDQLGFTWLKHEKQPWEKSLADLRDFIVANGHGNVPHLYAPNPRLGFFVINQRNRYAKGRLSPERIAQLEAVGFSWKSAGRDPMRPVRLKELAAFRERFGHCDVTSSWSENAPLGRWVRYQRKLREAGELEPADIRDLDALGFLWTKPANSRGRKPQG